MIDIRSASSEDREAIWTIFHEIVAAGDTYAFASDTPRHEGLRLWMDVPRATYVAVRDGEIVGTYYLKTNQPGRGAHVCNAAYMVRSTARGLGIGKAMCAHSLDEARRMGYRAMQFNLVVATNDGAIRLWRAMDFKIVGTLPGAFDHATLGMVDAYVLYRWL